MKAYTAHLIGTKVLVDFPPDYEAQKDATKADGLGLHDEADRIRRDALGRLVTIQFPYEEMAEAFVAALRKE